MTYTVVCLQVHVGSPLLLVNLCEQMHNQPVNRVKMLLCRTQFNMSLVIIFLLPWQKMLYLSLCHLKENLRIIQWILELSVLLSCLNKKLFQVKLGLL
ncbi:hypothetical protein V6N12_066184 [Hibiscus sabdariffa]|uniref:Uncharacterized protein n=1 Tax=Hibiscus sabdariffa TaxID=183260 RepID=A0ABR2B924_9ROSI